MDGGLAAFEHQATVAVAFDAEHRLDVHAQHVPSKQRHQIKAGGSLRAIDVE